MAEGIVSFVLNKLSDAVVKEVLLLHGVGEQVEALSREFSRIQAFLKDADMKKILNERQKHWVEEVRDIAYDIEDVIDNAFVLKVSENPSKNILRGGWSRIVKGAKRTWSKPKRLPAFHNLADEINRIEARIQEINESRERYGINFLGEGTGERSRLPVRAPMLPDIDDPYVVGFDADRDKIVEQLLDTSSKRRAVISIVGPGGIGKTTLARKVYNSNDVKTQFEIRIWVAISQEYNLMDILIKIIEHVEPLPQSAIEKGGEEYLLTKLYKTLNGEMYTIKDYLHPKPPKPSDERDLGEPQPPQPRPKKYLLVLDSIWTSDIWTRIGVVLPDAEIGSRVIITTRFLNIADDAKPYKLAYLTEERSLELLLKKALPNQNLSKGYLDDLYEVGKQFAKRCGGLPLALVVLGGLLSKRPTNYAAWSKMLQTMNWGTDGKECTEILATSYNDLPFVLKSCFMYFAAFPEDHEIDAQRLLRLWVAEGLIPTEEFRTLEDTAESFLEDLVQRSLVQVSKRSHTSSITSCRIHDLLRELAIQKAKEENFLTICSKPDNWKSGTKARRVAVHYSGCSELMEHSNPNLRSLLFFEPPMPNCSRQRLLKVLSDMVGRNQGIEFECFNGPTQLRYCELHGRWNDEKRFFGSFIGRLRFVETLDLHLGDHGDLPDDIWNVKTLRHVKLNPYSRGPSSSADLRNLQTLTGVRGMESWYGPQLPKLPNVRDLDIKFDKCSWDTIAALLGTMNHLTHFSLLRYKVPPEIVHMGGFPINRQLHCLSLKEYKFKLHGYKFPLENGMFPIHVMELTLENLQFQDDPLPLLGKLSSLRMLRLVGEEANQKMSCSAGEFKQLHQLEFDGLTMLEEWEISEGAMPILELLTLKGCNRLLVPLGLQHLSDLKELNVSECRILQKPKQAYEIRNKCKHVPSISIQHYRW